MPAKLHLNAAPATFVSLAVILAVAAAGLVASSSASTARSRASGARRSAPAASTQPQCGDTITTDTTLHHNLVNCPNNGIIIGADDVTLDLNYHRIDGDGTAAAGCDPQTDFCDVGVVNFGNDGVTVVHGSLRQFAGGVDFGEVRHNRLLDISASKNQAIGIQLFGSSRSLIRNSSGIGSTDPDDGTGLGVFDSHRVRVLHNSARHNAGPRGIAVIDSNHNLIKGNRLSRGGITLGPGSHNVVKRNRVSRGRYGIRIEKGHDNLVADNVVRHARRAGILLGKPHPFLGGAHNTVRGNLVKGGRGDGFLVNAKDDHSLLKGNTATGAGDDGFDIQSHTAKLTRNLALRNADLGIAAVRGVIDGGGNRASGNGDLRQCTNIVCS